MRMNESDVFESHSGTEIAHANANERMVLKEGEGFSINDQPIIEEVEGFDKE
jgi:hypothetical protein